MTQDIAGASFPVVFSDGENESNIGSVSVYPSMDFKTFQSILSKKIGISASQFTIYLVGPDSRRRITVTPGNANFYVIARQKDALFLVVLKRSRRMRKGKYQNDLEENYEYPSLSMKADQRIVPEKMVLLRRNSEMANQAFPGFISPYHDRIAASEHQNYNRLLELKMQQEKLLIMSANSNPYSKWNSVQSMNGGAGSIRVSCKECLNSKMEGRPVEFHCCVHDPVIVGFRSIAGPIARPV